MNRELLIKIFDGKISIFSKGRAECPDEYRYITLVLSFKIYDTLFLKSISSNAVSTVSSVSTFCHSTLAAL